MTLCCLNYLINQAIPGISGRPTRRRRKGSLGIPVGPLETHNITATSCQLDWKPPSNSTYVLVKYYLVYRKKISDRDWGSPIEEVETTSCIVDGLLPETEYHFKVTAADNHGESAALESVGYIRTKRRKLPSPRGPLNVKDVEAHSCQLQWKCPKISGNLIFKCYEVNVREDVWNDFENSVYVRDTRCTVDGLSSDTSYHVQVIAFYDAGSIVEKSDPIETYIRTKPSIKQHNGNKLKNLKRSRLLYDTVSLESHEVDHQQICKEFYESVDSATFKIIKVERIKNETLEDQYKCIVAERNSSSSWDLEKKLWYGVQVQRTEMSPEPVAYINTKGFNRSLQTAPRGANYGQGVYFTVKASNALELASRDESGLCYVYYCRVMTGSFTNGRADLTTPPYKDNSGEIFDSVVDNVNSPSQFVIFQDNQAYPDYLITLQSSI